MACFVFYLVKTFQEFSKIQTKNKCILCSPLEATQTIQLFIECLITAGNRPIKILKYVLRTSEIPACHLSDVGETRKHSSVDTWFCGREKFILTIAFLFNRKLFLKANKKTSFIS